jgi:RNA polymerase-binding protein DksA
MVNCFKLLVMANRTSGIDQPAKYRSALIAERTRLICGRDKDLDAVVLPAGIAVDDQAPLIHNQFIALRQHRMERRKLRLIDAALRRLDRGEFGICDECGSPVPEKRLDAIPWAACCVSCQDQLDSRDDAEGDENLEMTA